jgi:tetratricopeptide (TPR) repeat protein
MFRETEKAITRAAVTKAALSELERLSSLLQTELGDSEDVSMEEVEDELREMGLDIDQPIATEVIPFPFEKTLKRNASATRSNVKGCTLASYEQDRGKRQPHVYVSNEPLKGECTEEVGLLMRGIRYLARQRRYEEALSLTRDAVRLAPSYWRARNTLGTLLALFGKIDDAEQIFGQVLEEFSDNPKAVAAALHGRAWLNEIRYDLAPPEDVLKQNIRDYEGSLWVDSSRTNTRACLLISRAMLDESSKHEEILEDSVTHEGFFDDLRFELDEHRTEKHKVLKGFPAWVRHLLYPIRPLHASEYSS